MKFAALFFLIFGALHAEKINIICYKNGVGLNQDIEILSEELTKLGHIVQHLDYRETHARPHADINVFVEVVNNFFFPFADKNYFIPNPEWYVFPREWIAKFDKILCKTREAERIFRPLNPNTTFMSFTSRDRYNPSVKMDYSKAIHLVGASIQKSTDLVIDTWLKNQDLPGLSIVRHTGNNKLPKAKNLELLYQYFSSDDLKTLQNSKGLHICPSITEGFGHYIVEAFSCGAVVVTTDGAPMNEMVTEKKCLVGHAATAPWRMATCYIPHPDKLKDTVAKLAALPEKELHEIGRKNREWYLQNDRFFKRRVAEIFAPASNKWVLTDFVWNLGMAASCDFGPNRDPGFHFRTFFQEKGCPYRTDDIHAGDVLWIRCAQIPRFYHETLPKLKAPIVLLINDGDESFPYPCHPSVSVETLINHPMIIHTFAQNCNYKGSSNKVSYIPIGIDFHTLAYKRYARLSWGPHATPWEQEKELKEVIGSFKPTHQRKLRAFVDFQHCDSMRGDCKRNVEFGEDRTSIFKRLQATRLIDFSNPMPRKELWQKKGEYAFSISPVGNGYDCHRTWEDLALGCIVIVKTSPVDPLYEGLPVVIVKDWSEITEANMKKWLAQYGDAHTNPVYREKLTNQYWLNKIRTKTKINTN